ncbi:MAG TPA: gamma-glutamyl-gamma-aminobutyrate hydrolase family protein [Anaeromyxobacteraceae bacterium]|nr:gamma-glutamyl-gamma-aminobutyrate hydrolase family protein [Anaeromyxobacteraceae bacterium]
MSRPRIGLTLDVAGDGRRYLLKREYADAVLEAGGMPVPLVYPPPGEAVDLLALVDGLVVTGGAFDVPPELYGEARRPACGPSKPERTEAELALLRQALAARLPLLGVCGGMQLLAVACGGTLWQDLPTDLGGRALGHEQPPPRDLPTHEVRIEPGTLLARLVGEEPLRVNSTHHQAVRDPGRGAAVSGRAADGVVEAIELPAHPFALGVQWHPEAVRVHEPRSLRVYAGLVEASRGRR